MSAWHWRDRPRVTCIVPAYNYATYIGEALDSALAQPLADELEIVVVDDGSTDDTPAVVAAYGERVRYVRKDNGGLNSSVERGLYEARGEFLTLLDADDVWPADKLALQLSALEAAPDVDLLFGHVRQFAADGELGPPQPGRLFGTMLVHRTALQRVGPFSTEWRVGELMEWLLRAREAALVELMTTDVVLHRRLHAANLGRARETRVDHVRILREALDRRRGAVGS